MRKTLNAVMLAGACLLALSGCIKYDASLTVTTDDTVDGTVIVAVQKDALEAMGQTADDLFATDGNDDAPVKGATVSDYDDAKFIGKKYTFEGASFDELTGEGAHQLRFTHKDGEITFDGKVELAEDQAQAVMYEGAEVELRVTFPGEVIETNGKVKGNTVTWAGDAQGLDAHATARDGDQSRVPLYVAGALAVIAAAVLTVRPWRLRRRPTEAVLVDDAETATPTE